jgi:hypothetical protein
MIEYSAALLTASNIMQVAASCVPRSKKELTESWRLRAASCAVLSNTAAVSVVQARALQLDESVTIQIGAQDRVKSEPNSHAIFHARRLW